MRRQIAHIRLPQCCLSGFCSVSRVTMVSQRGVHGSINYISVLSYARRIIYITTTTRVVWPFTRCDSFWIFSSRIVCESYFSETRTRQDEDTETHWFVFSFTRVARLSLNSPTVNGLSRREKTITFNPSLGTMIEAPAFIGSCKLTFRCQLSIEREMTTIDSSFAFDTLRVKHYEAFNEVIYDNVF